MIDVDTKELKSTLDDLRSLLEEYEEAKMNLFNQLKFSCIDWQDGNSIKFDNNIQEDRKEADRLVTYLKMRENLFDFIYAKYSSLYFDRTNFNGAQANRLTKYICSKYEVDPEFLWKSHPDYGVFRCRHNTKWFGIILRIDKNKLDKNSRGEIEIINVKLDDEVPRFLNIPGIYEAYHMNKRR